MIASLKIRPLTLLIENVLKFFPINVLCWSNWQIELLAGEWQTPISFLWFDNSKPSPNVTTNHHYHPHHPCQPHHQHDSVAGRAVAREAGPLARPRARDRKLHLSSPPFDPRLNFTICRKISKISKYFFAFCQYNTFFFNRVFNKKMHWDSGWVDAWWYISGAQDIKHFPLDLGLHAQPIKKIFLEEQTKMWVMYFSLNWATQIRGQ